MATKDDLEALRAAGKADLQELRNEMHEGFARLEHGQSLILQVVKGTPALSASSKGRCATWTAG